MSSAAPEGRATAQVPGAAEPAQRGHGRRGQGGRRRGRRVAAGLVAVTVLAAGAVAAWREGVLHSGKSPGPAQGSAPPPATALVVRRDLSQASTVTATLGYAGSYTVTGKGAGTLTWMPSPGQVIRQGQALYRVDNGTPVALLYGAVPAWRALAEGNTGSDVAQLNHDLVSLGYANSTDFSALGWDYYSWETAYGVERLEENLGVSSPDGSLPLGSVVFEPAALRVSADSGRLGNPAGGPVLAATSDQHVVTIALDASQQGEVAAGDAVTVTLPGGSVVPGVISSVGKVASGSGSSATIPVHVTLDHPRAAEDLDQAPVTVNITTASAKNALTVPVAALLARPSGGYAVEVAGPGGARHLVPVTTGIFDDTDGLVQVSGAGLAAGQHVVVPAT
ncbi:MAG: efflux RND transporter periplasmic adaptor subunit [Nocardiopsaceae bacterium]|nr:efflux RND transporter periplasmic adaptor subunit [Nocardiopsaceae bacterium]